MPQVTRTPEAAEDLTDILTYLMVRSPAAASRVAADIDRACQLLAQFPLMGAACDDLAPGMRRRRAGAYVVFYRPIPGGIEVIRVLHGARDFKSFFNP